MLTIKRVDAVGNWRLAQASTIDFDAAKNEVVAHPVLVGGETFVYTSGHLYVMNDFGKTVAVYNLEQKKEQQHV